MIDDFFFPGFIAFIKSFKIYNPWFNLPIVFIDVGLSEDNKKECRNYYDKIEFVEPKKKNYVNVNMDITSKILWNTYYKLDIFSMKEWDRIIFLDMDMLVLDNIKKVFECKQKIAGCLGYNLSNDKLRNDINTGLIVLNKPYIDDKIYKDIIHFCRNGFSMPDQRAIGGFFKDKIAHLPKEYNMEKRIYKSKKYNWKEAKILHYISQKPWSKEPKDKINQNYTEVENLWWEYYNR